MTTWAPFTMERSRNCEKSQARLLAVASTSFRLQFFWNFHYNPNPKCLYTARFTTNKRFMFVVKTQTSSYACISANIQRWTFDGWNEPSVLRAAWPPHSPRMEWKMWNRISNDGKGRECRPHYFLLWRVFFSSLFFSLSLRWTLNSRFEQKHPVATYIADSWSTERKRDILSPKFGFFGSFRSLQIMPPGYCNIFFFFCVFLPYHPHLNIPQRGHILCRNFVLSVSDVRVVHDLATQKFMELICITGFLVVVSQFCCARRLDSHRHSRGLIQSFIPAVRSFIKLYGATFTWRPTDVCVCLSGCGRWLLVSAATSAGMCSVSMSVFQ